MSRRQIVVTGAASGIGAATAQMVREAGDQVVGVDRHGVDVIADLSTRSGRQSAVAGVLDRTGGRVDAVVACAGTSSLTPLDIKVNFFGVVDLLDGLRPALATAAAPRVAITSSISATQPFDPDVVAACGARDEARALALADEAVAGGRGSQLYASSKRAVTQWVRRTAITDEWAGAGIALNAVGPGVVLTPMTEQLRSSEEGVHLIRQSVPSRFGGWMRPEVVADALVWLIRPENTHITGQMLFVDGGAEAVVRGENAY